MFKLLIKICLIYIGVNSFYIYSSELDDISDDIFLNIENPELDYIKSQLKNIKPENIIAAYLKIKNQNNNNLFINK